MKKKRGLLMIFVVILIAAASTIIAASVDLGRMAMYKQKQQEREATWQYCVESARAFVTETMVSSATYSQNFSQTVNGINLTVTNELDSWNDPWGCKMTVQGTLVGKQKNSSVFIGKRANFQPCQFAIVTTTKFLPDRDLNLTGDLYCAGTITGTNTSITGNVYGYSAVAPSFLSLSGSYIGRQPKPKITLNAAAYQAAASISTSGNTTLTNPTNLLSLTQSQLRYHDGTLTIKGSVTGEITVFVKGSVKIDKVVNSLSLLGRLVVICDGNVSITANDCQVFVICNGVISSTGGGARTITGSLACSELSGTDKPFSVVFDNYFLSNPNGGYRYRIPGQW